MARKIINDNFTILFQVESCGVSYSQYPESYGFDKVISDSILVKAKAVISEYKNIKMDDIIHFRFAVEPYLMNDECKPSAFGTFDMVDGRLSCYIYVAPSFPQRLVFMLQQGVKPYFDLCCYREKYRKPTVKVFRMEGEINLEDYL